MGSLNGDIMVMRNGRSTSQVSVYNYPEHLNPFYEDDQHKRLRFWKINKKDNDGRRNSFSIANLKDMWAFKSFRMKKKSSTLGINKTSESPPLLRRDYALDNGWNTFDNRLRASNTSSINSDNFQRNATYRSSLQTLPTNHADRIGLNRNDGYRSTIQVTRSNPRYQTQPKSQMQSNLGVSQNRRYVYGGSVTPQPLRYSRSNIGRGLYEYDSDNAMMRGSSQSSMVSTNPFESDEDAETEEFKAGMRNILNGSITTLTSRTPRKKRRAPAPPTPTHGSSSSNSVPLPTIRIDSSQDTDVHDDELHIKEDMDIAHLTAEIESFVKTKSNDDVEESPQENRKIKTKTTTADDTKNAEEQPPAHVTPKATIITEDVNISPKETVISTEKAQNGQVTIENVTASTNTNKLKAQKDATHSTTHISSDMMTSDTEQSQDAKANGAIRKKPNNNFVADIKSSGQQTNQNVEELCIRETSGEDKSSKPIPFKRQTKSDVEVGHVECIHVHVESPKASPRRDQPNGGLTSFKANETIEPTDAITTKTPFVLTSPPAHRRKQQQPDGVVEPVHKETVKIVENSSELNIEEERVRTKPDIAAKPAVSPKPVTKEPNERMQGYADIHRPTRRHNQNGQPVKGLREGSISPPFVPQQKTNNEEEKINNTDQCQTNGFVAENSAVGKPLQVEHLDNLKIVETTTTTVNCNGDFRNEENSERENHQEEFKSSNSVSVADHQEAQKPDEELDALYRPKPASHMEWKRSTLAPLETNIPPEKRKSVKDIIESINRSQRLLNAAANKDFPAFQKQQSSLNHNHHNNNNNLNELQEVREHKATDLAEAANSPSPSPSNDYNDNNSEIFQKCKVNKEVFDYRETSPITSNLDWNPVPKPKRTKAAQE